MAGAEKRYPATGRRCLCARPSLLASVCGQVHAHLGSHRSGDLLSAPPRHLTFVARRRFVRSAMRRRRSGDPSHPYQILLPRETSGINSLPCELPAHASRSGEAALLAPYCVAHRAAARGAGVMRRQRGTDHAPPALGVPRCCHSEQRESGGREHEHPCCCASIVRWWCDDRRSCRMDLQ